MSVWLTRMPARFTIHVVDVPDTYRAGTRIIVQNFLELVDEGISYQDIIDNYYPDLKVEDIQACIEYAQ